jgi:hypothetical protein
VVEATREPPAGVRARTAAGDGILIRRLVFVAFFLEVGLLLVVLPWSEFWERNYFALGWPVIQAIVTNNFVRGGISGLGIVNLIVGVTDLSHVFAARPGPDLPLDLDNHPGQN